MAKALKERSEIDNKYKWNIEAMYASDEDWEKDFEEVGALTEEAAKYQGRLGESAKTLLDAIIAKDKMWQKLEKVFVYAHQKKDEDNRNSKYQSLDTRCGMLIAKSSAALSFFTPELLSVPEETIRAFQKEERGLDTYAHVIDEVLREKAHILTQPEENILAQMSEVTAGPDEIFSMLTDADMKFGEVTDEKGEKVELTQGNYIAFMESYNRDVRKEAFEKKYQAYIDHINTISATYSYSVKTDVVTARIRKYEDALDAALSGDNIPKDVYMNLIKAVHDGLPAMHKYMKIRKKLLGVDELHMYDVYAPLIKIEEKEITFEDTVEMAKKGLAAMGEDYIANFQKGIDEGWIDVMENKGKTSGAYSFGSYDSYPYVLLNFAGKMNDAFTLVHEMGHSLHSYYTRATQPFHYGSHSIFTAETASTVNESLLMKYLIKDAKQRGDSEMVKYLINMHIEAFRTTLFRQTMFAEFELICHKQVEEGGTLTSEWMCEEYKKLNELYFGPDVVVDNEISYEWSRIPHFYRAYYVYKYATGYSAATAISKKIIEEGPEDYKKFLTTGDSDYPIELLKIAGIDMSQEGPVKSAMQVFSDLVDEFESLI